MPSVSLSPPRLRFPERDIGDLSVHLAIDKEIEALAEAPGRRAGVLHERFRSVPFEFVRQIGRRALNEAFNAATFEHEHRIEGDDIECLKDAVRGARKAQAALLDLLRSFGPGDAGLSKPALLSGPLRHAVREADDRIDILVAQAEAERRAKILLEATEIIAGYADFADRRRRRISSQRRNKGEVEKQELVRVSATYWTLLTGKVPGRGITPEGNPFLPFVGAIWSDLSGKKTSFESAIDHLNREAVKIEADRMAIQWNAARALAGMEDPISD